MGLDHRFQSAPPPLKSVSLFPPSTGTYPSPPHSFVGLLDFERSASERLARDDDFVE
jgi:hypothetical protein